MGLIEIIEDTIREIKVAPKIRTELSTAIDNEIVFALRHMIHVIERKEKEMVRGEVIR